MLHRICQSDHRETGVGKELFAKAIHEMSPRKFHPYIKINCAAIPTELLESELFGYEPGAFFGASKKGKPGKFELSDHGTILLDEIGEMPQTLQSKLLRVLQEHELTNGRYEDDQGQCKNHLLYKPGSATADTDKTFSQRPLLSYQHRRIKNSATPRPKKRYC
ncbi:MAG: sigma 54-interacting transcriptional regulator [Eubacterium ramulus]